MATPTILTNDLTPGVVNPGGTATWTTVAADADSRQTTLSRTVQDAAGGTVVFESTLTVSDPLTYETPTCDDPGVTLTVDVNDPTVVHVTVT